MSQEITTITQLRSMRAIYESYRELGAYANDELEPERKNSLMICRAELVRLGAISSNFSEFCFLGIWKKHASTDYSIFSTIGTIIFFSVGFMEFLNYLDGWIYKKSYHTILGWGIVIGIILCLFTWLLNRSQRKEWNREIERVNTYFVCLDKSEEEEKAKQNSPDMGYYDEDGNFHGLNSNVVNFNVPPQQD